jgi:hypothetical protein
MAAPTVYALCDLNCKFETMTKEQIIAAIAEATGTTINDVDTAFITMLKEQNNGASIRFWVGTQADYNELVASGRVENDVLYLTADGSKIYKLQRKVEEHELTLAEHGNRIDGHEQRIKAVELASGELAGTLPVNKGGTGATTAAAARANLGAAPTSHNHSASAITSGTLPIEYGGTGAKTKEEAINKLGIYYEKLIAKFGTSDSVTFTIAKSVKTCVATISGLYEMSISTSGVYYMDYLETHGDDLRVVVDTSTNSAEVTVRVWYKGSGTVTGKSVAVNVIYIV